MWQEWNSADHSEVWTLFRSWKPVVWINWQVSRRASRSLKHKGTILAVSAKRKAPQRFSVPAGNEVTDYCSDKEAVAQRSRSFHPLDLLSVLISGKGKAPFLCGLVGISTKLLTRQVSLRNVEGSVSIDLWTCQMFLCSLFIICLELLSYLPKLVTLSTQWTWRLELSSLANETLKQCGP